MSSDQQGGNSRVQVFVRCRPRIMTSSNALHAAERHAADGISKNGDYTVVVADKRTTASGDNEVKSQDFVFDGAFDQDSTQEEIYEYTTLDAVDAMTLGCDCSIFAYGQTGAGKSYSMLGSFNKSYATPTTTSPQTPQTPQTSASFSNDADVIHRDTGIFLRALHDLLNFSQSQKQKFHSLIVINVLEVYLDTVRDLLSKDPASAVKVLIMDDNVGIPDLTYAEIKSLHDAVQVYDQATKKRVARTTDSNDASSRSHALFNIDLYRQPITDANRDRPLTIDDIRAMKAATVSKKPNAVPPAIASQYASICTNGNMFMTKMGAVLASRITLTDLAGSERMKQANAKGAAFDEMVKINSSLTALGNVVHALHEGSTHIPYRDTRLTVLLRAGFASAGSRIVLIANVAPTVLTFDETYSTLLFANKVKAMKAGNKAPSNAGAEFVMQQQLTALLRKFDEFACDLRVFSAQQSPEEQKTKAIVAMIDTKFKKIGGGGTTTTAIEFSGKENDPRVEVVRNISESAKKERADALERIATDLPRQMVEAHKQKMDSYFKDIAGKRSLFSNSAETNKKLDEAIAEMQRELATRRDDIAPLETSKSQLQIKQSQLAKDLHTAATQLAEITTVTDPETIQLKQEQAQLRSLIEKVEAAFTTSFKPSVELIRARLKSDQEQIEKKQQSIDNLIKIIEEAQQAKAELAAETSSYDPEAIKSRTDLLDTQLVEEFDSSPWFLKPEDIIVESTSSPSVNELNNNNNSAPLVISPTSAMTNAPSPLNRSASAMNFNVNALGKKGPTFIPPPPGSRPMPLLDRSQSVALTSSSSFSGSPSAPNSPFLLMKKSVPTNGMKKIPPVISQMTRQQYFESLSQQQQQHGSSPYLSDRSQSCYVGPIKKAPPPPPVTFDKDGNLIRLPMVGKKAPPPPPSTSSSRSISAAIVFDENGNVININGGGGSNNTNTNNKNNPVNPSSSSPPPSAGSPRSISSAIVFDENGNVININGGGGGNNINKNPSYPSSPLSTTSVTEKSSSMSPQANFYDNYNDNVRSASVQLYGSSTGKLPPPPLLPQQEQELMRSPSTLTGSPFVKRVPPPPPPSGYPPGWNSNTAGRSQSVMVQGGTYSTVGEEGSSSPSAATKVPPQAQVTSKTELMMMMNLNRKMPPPPSSRPSTDPNGRSVSSFLPPPVPPSTRPTPQQQQHVDPMANATATATQDAAGWNIQEFNSDTDEGDVDDEIKHQKEE